MQKPSDSTSHEVDRHIDDQPARDDLLDPDEVRPDVTERDAIDPDHRPVPREDQPDSQGFAPVDAPSETEDTGARHVTHDELATDPLDHGEPMDTGDGMPPEDAASEPGGTYPMDEAFSEVQDDRDDYLDDERTDDGEDDEHWYP